eukprot:14354042-Ditylum_brightwellii.AAC.1
MEFIAPMSTESIKSGIKFIPATMPYDKPLPNAASKYTDLLQEQNKYLERYDSFKIGGVHKAVLDYAFTDGSTIWSIMLAKPYIMGIHSTIYTTAEGIWTIETNKQEIHKAIQWMEEHNLHYIQSYQRKYMVHLLHFLFLIYQIRIKPTRVIFCRSPNWFQKLFTRQTYP